MVRASCTFEIHLEAVLPTLPVRLLLALAVVFPAASSAQQDVTETQSFPVERLRISTNRQGLIDVEDASVAPHLTLDAGLWLGYSRNPLLVYELENNARLGSLVQNRLGGALVASVGLYERFEVGVDLPIILYQGRSGNIPGALVPGSSLTSLSTTGAGDLRLLGKWQLLRQKDHGVNLAVMPAVTLPSGGGRAYFGDAGPVFAPEVLVSWGRDRFRAGANLGAVLRRRSELLNVIIQSELTGHAGAGYRFQAEDGTGGPPLELEASLSMSVSAARPFQSSNESHLELRGMAAYDLGNAMQRAMQAFGGPTQAFGGAMQVFGGAGLGLARGWGTPDWRLFAGVRYGNAPPPPPAPLAPLTPQGPLASQGPKVAVVEPADRDHDGIPDRTDACPDVPETKNGYQDDDGCPDEVTPPPPAADPDRDDDGVPDRIDNCPDEPGPASNQGCVEKQLVQITTQRLEILERVFFKSDQAVIERRSYPVLENVVAVIKNHPEMKHVLVEGHTDNRGPEDYNQDLSDRRAAEVMKFLVDRGIARERLKAQGFGPTRPVADNATSEGRDKNRRVVFTVLDADEAERKDSSPDGAAPATIPPVGTKPEAAKPAGTKPEAAKPAEAKPEAAKPAGTKPEAAKPVGTKPEAAKPAEAKPEAAKPAVTKQIASEHD
jgi:outer membrane protein OmpA-like peptidoglycan-associated protein